MGTSTIHFSLLIAFLTCLPLHAQSVVGQWTIIEGQVAGQKVPPEILAAMSLKLDQSTFEAKSGTANSSGMLTNNPRTAPFQMVFKINKGADSGREIKAIYQFVNGNLQIAFSQTAEFPTVFESSSDNKYLLLTYKAPPVSDNPRNLQVQAVGGS